MISPIIYIVVLNWNNYEDSRECLLSLRNLNYSDFKVILVDNGSEDRSGEKLAIEFPNVIFIETGKNLGYAGGNNIGMRYALDMGAEIVLVINNDVVVASPFLLKNIAITMNERKNIGIVGPRIHDYYERNKRLDIYNSSLFYHFIENSCLKIIKESWTMQNGMSLKYVNRVSGCGIAFSRELLEKVGLFDERFFLYAEEIDLCFRAINSGFYVINIDDDEVKLFHKSKVGYVPPRVWYYISRNVIHLINNNFVGEKWLFCHLLNIIVVLRRVFVLAVKFDFGGAVCCLKGHYDGLLGRYGQTNLIQNGKV